ncbi:MAG: imidazole glycerol phosphate synthase subunit HisH [Vicingaceae bacterium]|nr:imidazole glycerol phosphate synthase subunit HisH [Vicingaceae bacterium]
MITIVNYGAGNIKSIQNMLKKLGIESEISNDKTIIEKAEKLILPGVGHFDYGMQQLKKSGLIEILNQKVIEQKTPLLGICLGAQMLGNRSEEGSEKGLGWIDMDVIRFDTNQLDAKLKVPHMNWNEVSIKKNTPLLTNLDNDSRFYFVHSFHMKTNNSENILCTSNYGYEFVSGVNFNNIYGVQFHPEKSHKFGMQLLSNFAAI